MEKKHIENMANKKTAQIMKKENYQQTTMILNKNAQLAAIYVSDEAKKEVNISKQVEACQKFLSEKGFKFSGDLFLKKEGTDHIDELVRARARSRRFDYMVSYLLCPGKSPGFFIGMIVCWNAQNFLIKPIQALR